MTHDGLMRLALTAILLAVLPGCLRFIDVVVEDKGYDAALTFPQTPTLSGPVPSAHLHFASGSTRLIDESVAAPTPPARETRESTDGAVETTTLQDVYFDYDSWRLSEDGTETLVRDAEWLRSHPGRTLIVEGHCDDRGTLEYNLVLGEKRARAVRNFLVNLDVPARYVKAVSYGKERPFCNESDESCYRVNRRGHLTALSRDAASRP